MKFFILSGLPGSGKTTYGKELRVKDNCFVVCLDTIRLSLNGNVFPRGETFRQLEPLVYTLTEIAILALLKGGHNVAIDEVNLDTASRKKWAEIARSIIPDIEIIILWFKSNYDSLERWQSERGHSEAEYYRIRSKIEAEVEQPSSVEGKVIIIE